MARGLWNAEPSRTVEIPAFVDRARIPPPFFETPHSLAPGKPVIRTRQVLALVLLQQSTRLMSAKADRAERVRKRRAA